MNDSVDTSILHAKWAGIFLLGTIASQLVISGKTVRNHVSNIFNKLQVVDRAQAIIRARDAGLGT